MNLQSQAIYVHKKNSFKQRISNLEDRALSKFVKKKSRSPSTLSLRQCNPLRKLPM